MFYFCFYSLTYLKSIYHFLLKSPKLLSNQAGVIDDNDKISRIKIYKTKKEHKPEEKRLQGFINHKDKVGSDSTSSLREEGRLRLLLFQAG